MPNYILLEKITVGAAGASSVTFSGIPQTGYTDLVLSTSNRITGSNPTINLRFNSDTTATNYYRRTVLSYGSGVSSNAVNDMGAGGYSPISTYTASTFGSTSYYIPNYTGSNQKSYSTDSVTENNNASDYYSGLLAGLWTGTAAITSITIYPADSTNWVANSTFYLYGVAKLGTTPAIVPYATGGDTIMTDGTYWYHAFRSSGTFTPTKGLSADVLVVAGGGGTSGGVSGGGGAGGVLAHSAQSLAANTGYTATVGAGGGSGANGSNSQFASLTASVGGGKNEANGGSGGGQNGPGSGAIGTGTSGQGNSGGARGSNYAGGGGGAGGAGGTGGANSRGGDGGAGLNTWSTWLNTTGTGVSGFIAGGGGGSAWNGVTPNNTGGNAGSGGGGAGGEGGAGSAQATNGVANTGGGAGGDNTSGKLGGSGLVIVRYPV